MADVAAAAAAVAAIVQRVNSGLESLENNGKNSYFRLLL